MTAGNAQLLEQKDRPLLGDRRRNDQWRPHRTDRRYPGCGHRRGNRRDGRGAGKVDCDGFLRATAADNPLVVFAPAVITGTTISVRILDMIGHHKPPAEVQAAADQLGPRVAGSVALGADEIRERSPDYPRVARGRSAVANLQI
jgi:hypothetical protein